MGRQIRLLILCFCPVRGLCKINPPYIFPSLLMFVGSWYRVIHSNKQRDSSSSPFNTTQTFFSSPWRFSWRGKWVIAMGCKDPAKNKEQLGLKLTDSLGHSGLVLVYFTTLDGQQLYLQCVPISPSKQ